MGLLIVPGIEEFLPPSQRSAVKAPRKLNGIQYQSDDLNLKGYTHDETDSLEKTPAHRNTHVGDQRQWPRR